MGDASRVGEPGQAGRGYEPLAGAGRAVQRRGLPEENPVREGADPPRVRRGTGLAYAADDLRRPPQVRAHAARQVGRLERSGDTEVDEDSPSLRRDPDVRRLDVAVDDALRREVRPDVVEELDRVGDLPDPAEGRAGLHAVHGVVEVGAGDPVGDGVDDPEVTGVGRLLGGERGADEGVHLVHEVRVLDLGEDRAPLRHPPVVVDRQRRQHLQGHGLAGAIDDRREDETLPAGQRRLDVVGGQLDAVAPVVAPWTRPSRRHPSTSVSPSSGRSSPWMRTASTTAIRLSEMSGIGIPAANIRDQTS